MGTLSIDLVCATHFHKTKAAKAAPLIRRRWLWFVHHRCDSDHSTKVPHAGAFFLLLVGVAIQTENPHGRAVAESLYAG
jgi:hypothetical protein